MKTTITHNLLAAALLILMLPACQRNNSDWENLDYEKIARENYRREYDSNYTPPTVSGCVDDDLFNCSGRSR